MDIKPALGYCLTLEEANGIVREHEDAYSTRYGLLRADPHFGSTSERGKLYTSLSLPLRLGFLSGLPYFFILLSGVCTFILSILQAYTRYTRMYSYVSVS